jgi:hypothetical protein
MGIDLRICYLYKPFHDITNEMSKDMEITIAKVCSSILYLKHDLTSFAKKESE